MTSIAMTAIALILIAIFAIRVWPGVRSLRAHERAVNALLDARERKIQEETGRSIRQFLALSGGQS